LPIEQNEETGLLELERLNAGYGPSQVLFDLSMSVREGEIVSIIGRNGVGKRAPSKPFWD